MSGSAFHVRVGRALLGAGAAIAVGAAAVIAFQEAGLRSVPIAAAPAAALDATTAGYPQGVPAPDAVQPTFIQRWALYFDSTFVGYARSVDGCTTAFDIVETTDKGVSKGLDKTPHVQPCVVEHALMPSAFESWVVNEVNRGQITNPDSLGIVGIDNFGTPVVAIRLIQPLLVGFDIPAASTSTPSAGVFDSTIDGTRIEIVSPSIYPAPTGPGTKAWSTEAFTLSVNGDKVLGIGQVSGIGLTRSDVDRNNPGLWEVSNVDIQTTGAKQTPFPKWWSSVLSDPTGTPQRSMSLEFDSPTLAPVFRVDLGGVGMYQADSALHSKRTFSLYAETAAVAFPSP